MSKNSDIIEAITDTAASWVARHDAGLSAPETAKLKQWLAADARHRAAFECCARIWAALRRPLLAGEQVALARALQARARRRHANRSRVAIASASAIVVLAFAILWQRPSADTAAQSSRQPPREVSLTRVTSPEQRLLDDGSTVELKQDAVIDVRYDDAVRRVVLVSGEAHFQVKKGLSRPFVVVAGGIEVRAVGTAFAVGLGAKKMEVWVTAGRVAVEKPAEDEGQGSEDGGQEIGGFGAEEAAGAGASPSPVPCPPSPGVAPAGGPVLVATLGVCERIVVETVPVPGVAAPVVTPVTPTEINERLAWRISRLEFSATPLAEAVALINRHSRLPDGSANARLVLGESLSSLEAEPVSGYFYANDIESFVKALNMIMEVESEHRGDEIVLRKREK